MKDFLGNVGIIFYIVVFVYFISGIIIFFGY